MWNLRVKVITNASLGKNVHGVFADNALAGFGDKGFDFRLNGGAVNSGTFVASGAQ